MALGPVIIQEPFEESPRLTYRARSREAFGSNLEVFAEEPELMICEAGGAEAARGRASTLGSASSLGNRSLQSPVVNGEGRRVLVETLFVAS